MSGKPNQGPGTYFNGVADPYNPVTTCGVRCLESLGWHGLGFSHEELPVSKTHG